MSTKTRFTSKLLATTIFCGALSLAMPAYAQDGQCDPNDADDPDCQPQAGPAEAQTTPDVSATGEPTTEGQTIFVTGSRIPQPNLTATSPVTVVNSQEVRLTGTTRTEDLINSLPQAFAAQGANISNGASGTATLNLRGLGSERTLVLINGRRLVPGDPFSSAADINMIPAFMIDRVDVLTGGASSVYGADAVSGVVNFIMDTDFEGIRLDSQYSFYQHENGDADDVIDALDRAGFGYPTGNVADGGTFDIGLAFGVGFDDGRGHITAYAGYRNINAVLQAKRDYSSCATAARNGTTQPVPPLLNCSGSGTSAEGNFLTNVGTFTLGPDRTIVPGFTTYNFNPLNYFQRPDERYTAGLFAEYEISRALQPYMEFMFMDDRTEAQIAPSGSFFSVTNVNCDNPLLSAQQRAIICSPTNLVGFTPPTADDPDTPEDETDPGTPGTVFTDPLGNQFNRGIVYIGRRNVEGGGRLDTIQHTSFRVVAGMRGDLSDIWSYDAFYQFGRTNYADTYLNDFSVTRLGRATDVVTDPDTGQPVCRSVLTGEDPNCVPWDIWVFGGVDPSAIDYLQTPGFQRGFTEETVAGASLTGSLGEWGLQFPWATSGVGIALGVEYRKERLDLQTDLAFQTNDLAGQGAPTLPVSGDYDVREVFGELRIPIVEESFIHELSLELGYRYSDYGVLDRSFNTDTYKIAGFFAPVQDIRFRGGYNRAVRAPNIQELFAPNRVALGADFDPCAGDFNPDTPAGPPEATAAACALTGVSAAQYGSILENPAGQYNAFIGGNPDLDPEVADTWTVGAVIQPRFLPRFALTVDWFDIEIADTISGIGANTILEQCLLEGNTDLCPLIQRDAQGTLWLTSNGFVIDTTQNIGGLGTRGLDIGASWTTDVGTFGSLAFNFVGTWLDELTVDTGVSPEFDCAGLYGNICGTPNPEWRHTARVSWNHPDGYGATVRWRHFASVDQDTTELGGAVQAANEKIPSQNYIDLALSFRVGDHYSFRLGVNNLLDRDPPIVGTPACPAGICNGNTFAQVYDVLGRYIFAGVTLNF